MQTEDGRVIDVDKIERREGKFTVYNFKVEGFHTYFVSDLGILVHNANYDPRKLQHEYKHASDFGVVGNWNNANRDLFQQSIETFINSAPTQIQGTYRGSTPVTHYFDPATNLWAAVDGNGDFIAGWRLSPDQVSYLFSNGNVQ